MDLPYNYTYEKRKAHVQYLIQMSILGAAAMLAWLVWTWGIPLLPEGVQQKPTTTSTMCTTTLETPINARDPSRPDPTGLYALKVLDTYGYNNSAGHCRRLHLSAGVLGASMMMIKFFIMLPKTANGHNNNWPPPPPSFLSALKPNQPASIIQLAAVHTIWSKYCKFSER